MISKYQPYSFISFVHYNRPRLSVNRQLTSHGNFVSRPVQPSSIPYASQSASLQPPPDLSSFDICFVCIEAFGSLLLPPFSFSKHSSPSLTDFWCKQGNCLISRASLPCQPPSSRHRHHAWSFSTFAHSPIHIDMQLALHVVAIIMSSCEDCLSLPPSSP